MEDKIHELDIAVNVRVLSDEEVLNRKKSQIELWTWLRRKESYWAHNSRTKWLKEGDKNTRYFHTVETMRKRKNCIDTITTEGDIIEEPFEIKQEAAKYFQNIFKEDHNNRPTFCGLGFNTLNYTQATSLIEKFSHAEIDQVVASCDGSKAPRPDGFNFKFIKD